MLANSLLNDGYAQRDNLWAWLDQQPPSTFTRSARGWILNAVGWKDPDAGLEYLDRLPDTEENRETLQQGIRSLINGGSQLERLEPLLEKASAKIRPYLIEISLQHGMAYIGDRQSKIDFKPEVWLARIEELPADRRSNAMMGVAQGWAANDPEGALKWATALPDAAQRQQAFMGAVSTWVRNDPYEAAAWVGTLPKGADRDSAAQSLANSLCQSQPETAWTWAMSIENPDARRSSMQFAYWSLQKKDPAIADEMLKSANLTPAEVETLQKARSPF